MDDAEFPIMEQMARIKDVEFTWWRGPCHAKLVEFNWWWYWGRSLPSPTASCSVLVTS